MTSQRREDGPEAGRNGLVKRSTCVILVALALLVGAFFGNAATVAWMAGRPEAPVVASEAAVEPAVDQRSLDRLERAAAEHPTDAEAWIALGNHCFDAGLSGRAAEAYERALELAPMRADVWSDLGVMYRRTGRFHKAVDAFGQAAKIDAGHVTARYNMGVVYYYDLQDRGNALKVWKGLLVDDPQARTPDGRRLADLIREIEGK